MADFEIKNGILVKYTGKDKNIIIPDSVEKIGENALQWCNSLESVTIPESVKSIGDRAFKDCKRLKNIEIPDSVTRIGDNTFTGCESLESIKIPYSVVDIGTSIFGFCTNLVSVEVDKYNQCYCSENDVLFSKSKFELISYPAGKKDTIYEIPENVMKISEGAFLYCRNLTSVTLPVSVMEIGENAFFFCINL
ncbi:MAG: leucine-rich repeat domain-containing protein, partial [Ruminococcus sp.]|nr:leucine-rich repeat domain-containing protein [Ruminococcus sp.]